MSLPDELIIEYIKLLTDIPEEEINSTKSKLKGGNMNPRDAKIKLAFEIVRFYYSEVEAQKAKDEFDRVFSKKEMPSEMPTIEISGDKLNIIDFLAENNLVASKSEARRLVEQKGIKINGEAVEDWNGEIEIKDRSVVRIGKRRFVRIKTLI